MAKKYDGIIEAVRYAPNGRVALVRAYERRGAAFSDRVLLDRNILLGRLKKGKKYLLGTRLAYLGSSFQEGSPVRVVKQSGDELLVAGLASSSGDVLDGAPLF